MSDSTDVEVRCKTCGRRMADVTIRVESDAEGRRALGSIRWALGIVRHPECRDQAPRR